MGKEIKVLRTALLQKTFIAHRYLACALSINLARNLTPKLLCAFVGWRSIAQVRRIWPYLNSKSKCMHAAFTLPVRKRKLNGRR